MERFKCTRKRGTRAVAASGCWLGWVALSAVVVSRASGVKRFSATTTATTTTATKTLTAVAAADGAGFAVLERFCVTLLGCFIFFSVGMLGGFRFGR